MGEGMDVGGRQGAVLCIRNVIGWTSWQAQMRVDEVGRVLQVCSWHNCRLITILNLCFLSQQVERPLSNAQWLVGGYA